MPTATIAGTDVELNDEGFFDRPRAVDRGHGRRARPRARASTQLTDRHWQVIRFMRTEYFDKGTGTDGPRARQDLRRPVKELYQLFPKGPAKIAAKIAGIPKPRGCI